MATDNPTLFTFPAHLQASLSALSALPLPAPLQARLDAALSAAAEEVFEDAGEVAAAREIIAGARNVPPKTPNTTGNKDEPEEEKPAPKPRRRPATIDGEVLEEIARWAGAHAEDIRGAGLDPAEYGTIPLLAGTTLYLPPRQRALARVAEMNSDKPNPFLPDHLSPHPPSFGSEYRSLLSTLSTVLNVLFSVFGAGGAAYAAAVSTGWDRTQAVLLAVVVGAVVAVADLGLLLIYARHRRIRKEKEEAVRVKMSRGSGAEGIKEAVLEGEKTDEELDKDIEDRLEKELGLDAQTTAVKPKSNIRLRRRGLGESIE